MEPDSLDPAGSATAAPAAAGADPLAVADPSPLMAALDFLVKGGPALWAIAFLSVLTLALILWKLWRLTVIGAWRGQRAAEATARWREGRVQEAVSIARGGRGVQARFTLRAFEIIAEEGGTGQGARERAEQAALDLLSLCRSGLRGLELIATIAPLLGLLGTVLGMIEAFQALETAGARADPSDLAGGIWEALLTTAAGMAVAIPALAGLTWFEAVITRVGRDMERNATEIFSRPAPRQDALAAE